MTTRPQPGTVTPDDREVIVHAVIGAIGHGVGPTERRSLLSERHPGTLAERVAVPTWNLIDKPAGLDRRTTWLTAYRMLFRGATTYPPAGARHLPSLLTRPSDL